MHRRRFIQSGLTMTAAMTLEAAAPQSLAAAVPLATLPKPRLFDVTTTVDLPNKAASQLWLPLFQSAGNYQKLVGMSWESDADVRVDRDPAYGARVLHARWAEGAATQKLSLTQRVATWERTTSDASPVATAAERAFWTRPNPGSAGSSASTHGIVRDTARHIVGTLTDPKAQVRAIYDWVIANTYRDAKVAGCGTGDITAMLRDKRYGGKCVDINSLMVGLCRAIGIPARDLYGIRLADSQRFKSLGRSGTVTGAQHCKAEVYLEEAGWFAVDPADVRKAVLEEKLPVDSPQIVKLANDLFGGAENNWAGYNSATGIALQGAEHTPSFAFMMYPESVCKGAVSRCLDAASFQYRITSAEILV